jgi:hypothetical protein
VARGARWGLVLALAFLACAHGDKTFERGTGGVQATAQRPLIRLARAGACLGACPTYSVEVDIDGRVTYVGVANVMTVGGATGQLSSEALVQLRGAIGKASHAKVPTERCACGCVTDAPDVTLTTWEKDVPKTVTYDEGCERAPRAVRTLEAAVDEAVSVEHWIGTIQQRRLCFEEQRDCSAVVAVPTPH